MNLSLAKTLNLPQGFHSDPHFILTGCPKNKFFQLSRGPPAGVRTIGGDAFTLDYRRGSLRAVKINRRFAGRISKKLVFASESIIVRCWLIKDRELLSSA